MKPTRIGKPYTVTDHGKAVTRVYVWFPDGTRELMSLPRAIWTMEYGKPPKGWVVYPKDGMDLDPKNMVCIERGKHARRTRRKMSAKVKAYTDHKPYPLAA